MSKKKERAITGRFSNAEDEFIKTNHGTLTDKAIGDSLNRDPKSVTNRRNKLKLGTSRKKPKITEKHRDSFIATLEEDDKRKFFDKEINASARFRALKDSLSKEEGAYYKEKYSDFMMDSTIETMTAMEKDALHQLLISEIRINRHMGEEKKWLDMIDTWDGEGKPPAPISRAKEIRECQEVIMKCQASLNVERKQRLKNQSDQSITFTNLIKEMKNPQTRYAMGAEATMLKHITEKFYNDRLGKNIFSGNDKKFDLDKNFRNGKMPELGEDFLPPVEQENKDG